MPPEIPEPNVRAHESAVELAAVWGPVEGATGFSALYKVGLHLLRVKMDH